MLKYILFLTCWKLSEKKWLGNVSHVHTHESVNRKLSLVRLISPRESPTPQSTNWTLSLFLDKVLDRNSTTEPPTTIKSCLKQQQWKQPTQIFVSLSCSLPLFQRIFWHWIILYYTFWSVLKNISSSPNWLRLYTNNSTYQKQK